MLTVKNIKKLEWDTRTTTIHTLRPKIRSIRKWPNLIPLRTYNKNYIIHAFYIHNWRRRKQPSTNLQEHLDLKLAAPNRQNFIPKQIRISSKLFLRWCCLLSFPTRHPKVFDTPGDILCTAWKRHSRTRAHESNIWVHTRKANSIEYCAIFLDWSDKIEVWAVSFWPIREI